MYFWYIELHLDCWRTARGLVLITKDKLTISNFQRFKLHIGMLRVESPVESRNGMRDKAF